MGLPTGVIVAAMLPPVAVTRAIVSAHTSGGAGSSTPAQLSVAEASPSVPDSTVAKSITEPSAKGIRR